MRRSIRKYGKINRRTQKRHGVSKIKYKCVRLRSKSMSKSRRHRRIGGAASTSTSTTATATTTSIPATATFPMVIDKNNVLYSCTAMPSS